MKISGYGAKAGGNFILLASSDFSFSGLLIRKSLNLHHREFHVSGKPTSFEGISDPPKLKNPRTVIGRSELLAHRTKSKSK
jgi:hypothetical protein